MDENTNFEPQEHDRAYVEMMKLFDTLTFSERMKRTIDGISKPKDTGEYKFAKLQLQLIGGKLFSVVAVVAVILILLSLKKPAADLAGTVAAAEIIDPVIEDPIEEPPPPPEDPIQFDPVDVDFDGPSNPFPSELPNLAPTPLSPKPAEMNSVAIVKSPIVMRNIMGSRNPGAIGKALGQYGGSQAGEATVLRALRWLKSKQLSNGSWPGQPTAMTGLALLSFLAHGETPGTSEEFGATVEKGIRYLTENQKDSGYFGNGDGNNYAHPIATYALCEAYSMTKVPMIKTAAEKALRIVVRGQNKFGSWDYKMNAASDRSDTSYAGWCAQAIKAGKIAEDLDVPGLDEAYKKSIDGFKINASPSGGFGYTSPARGGLTGVGVLCMQLLGASNEQEVKNSLNFLDECTYSFEEWKKQPYSGGSPIYYWYYITQAKFHAGGQRWTKWNSMFAPELIKTQIITPKAIMDTKGEMRDIGHWESPSESEHHGGDFGALVAGDGGRVQDTCLSVLQLMVYYRHLPTFKTPEIVDTEVVKEDKSDIKVNIVF